MLKDQEYHTRHSLTLQFLPTAFYSCSIKVYQRRNKEAQISVACVLMKSMKQPTEGSFNHKGLEVLYLDFCNSKYLQIVIDWKMNYHVRKSALCNRECSVSKLLTGQNKSCQVYDLCMRYACFHQNVMTFCCCCSQGSAIGR